MANVFSFKLDGYTSETDNRLYTVGKKKETTDADFENDELIDLSKYDLLGDEDKKALREILWNAQEHGSDTDINTLNRIFKGMLEKADSEDKKTQALKLYNAIIDGLNAKQIISTLDTNKGPARLKRQLDFMEDVENKLSDKFIANSTEGKEILNEKALTFIALNRETLAKAFKELKSNGGKVNDLIEGKDEIKSLLKIVKNSPETLTELLNATEKDANGKEQGFTGLKGYKVTQIKDNKIILSGSTSERTNTGSSTEASGKSGKAKSTRAHSSSEASENEEVAEGDSDEEVEDSDRETSESKLKARVEKLTKIEKQIESQLGIGNSGFDGILTDLSPTNKERISNLTERVTMLEEALGESAGGEEFSDSDTKEERLNKIQGKLKYLAKGLNANPEIAANLRNSYAQRSNNGMFGNSNFGGSPYTGGFQGNNGGFHAGVGFQNHNGGFYGGVGFSGGMRGGGGGMGMLLNNPKYSDIAAGWIIGGAIGSGLGNLASAFINRNNNSNYYSYGGCPSFPPYMPPSGCYGLYT